MTTSNRRKEGKPESKTEEVEENSTSPLKNAIVAEAGRNKALLPSDQPLFIPTIESVVTEWNMRDAMEAVMRNKGAPGIDGITVEEIEETLDKDWPRIKQEILNGKYYPQPVRRVEIPKPDGGARKLGIPTVLDRIIQQAIYQRLVHVFDLKFSQYSYGFRPRRSTHQAVLQAQKYIQEDGCEWVVDIDLEKFFDKVNHDMLMARIARHVKDKKILLLIRRFLQAGAMEDGLVKVTGEGTPQGCPLSPLLSNIMLDDFDKELEKRGLRFARYADDCNIYVKSERAGKRVMESVVKYLTEKLKLKVNTQKSAVDNPWNRKFLGFTFTKDKKRIKVHESRVKRFKDKVREVTRKMRGNKVEMILKKGLMPIIRGWANYFKLAEEQGIFKSLDGWIRRKIRGYFWRQWKNPETRIRRLITLGIREETARLNGWSGKGPWRMARSPSMHRAMSNKYMEAMGYISMASIVQS